MKKMKATKSRAPKAKPAAGDADRISTFKDGLKRIIDPHTGVNIVDMGMAQNIVAKDDKASLDFIPTSPFCPVVNYFVDEIKKAAKAAGFSDCEVRIKF